MNRTPLPCGNRNEPMMHRTRAEYDNHYLTDVFKIRKGDNPISPLLLRYKTGKGDNFILDMHII
jgi:hypothetical protein